MDNEKNKADQDQAAIAKIQILVGKTKADPQIPKNWNI
jgi:hypothetical protein